MFHFEQVYSYYSILLLAAPLCTSRMRLLNMTTVYIINTDIFILYKMLFSLLYFSFVLNTGVGSRTSSVDSARARLRMPHSDGTASQTRASISRFRSFAAPTFPPVLEHRVHRVYSDTADSSVTPPNSHAPPFSQSASDHVLITRCLLFHWSFSATPLFLIGNMLPPARAL